MFVDNTEIATALARRVLVDSDNADTLMQAAQVILLREIAEQLDSIRDQQHGESSRDRGNHAPTASGPQKRLEDIEAKIVQMEQDWLNQAMNPGVPKSHSMNYNEAEKAWECSCGDWLFRTGAADRREIFSSFRLHSTP